MKYYPAVRVIKLQLHTMWMNLKNKQTNKQTNTKKQPTKMCSKRSQIQTNAYVQFYLKQELVSLNDTKKERMVTGGFYKGKSA